MAPEWEDNMLGRVAKALYDTNVKHAREFIESLNFDPAEVEELVTKLKTESQTAQILIFYSYLDDRIQQLIKLQLRPDLSNNELERLFGASGPLNTFNNRVLLAYQLGWLSKHMYTRLEAFRKIRNECTSRLQDNYR